jgi:two-component system LytT family sensor kinase
MISMRSGTLFWIVNTAGWFTFLLFSGVFFGWMSGQLNGNTLILQLTAFVYYLPASGLLRHLIHRLGWFEQQKHGWLMLQLLLITFLLALTGQFIISLVMMYGLNMMTWATYSVPILLMTTVQNWIVLCLWTLLYLVLKQFRINRQQRIHQLELERSVKEAELMALKAQLNPHFIFNCLNNMRALALDDGPTTRQMITHLSEILKYSFQYEQQTRVTVEREIQHVNNYLALEAIHFEQRLQTTIEVDPAVNQVMIPPLSIQLLVENAIKHGISLLPGGGTLTIRVEHHGDRLQICVGNHGQLRSVNDRAGIGLNNLRQRLQLLYGSDAQLQLEQIKDGWVLATITLPLEHNHHE